MIAPARRALRWTPFGKSALVLALTGFVLTGAAAFLPGAEMLPAAPALLLLALAAAPALAWLQLRGLAVEPPTARTVFAGESFDLRPVLHNGSQLFAARDLVLAVGDGVAGRMRPVGYHRELPPGAVQVGAAAWRLPRRGRADRCVLTVASSFPFGLVERRLVFVLPAELLALPRLGTVRELGPLLRPAAGSRLQRTTSRDGGEEFYGLRDWREGESPRLVHWKLSARRGRPVVRELEGLDRPPVRLVLSGFVPDELKGERPHPGFERAVVLTATLVEHLLRRRYQVRLAFAGERSFERGAPVPHAHGLQRGALRSALADLALVQPATRRRQVSGRALLERARRQGELAILVLAGGPLARRDPRASSGLVLHVDDPSLDDVFSSFRRGESLAAALRT